MAKKLKSLRFTAILLLLLSILVSACDKASEVEVLEENTEPVTLRILLSVSNEDLRDKLPIEVKMKQFMAEHPNVTIKVDKLINFSYERMFSRLSTSKKEPAYDLIQLVPEQMRYLYEKQFISDLNPYLMNRGGSWDPIYENLLKATTFDGAYLGIPITAYPIVMYFKPEAFDAAGIPYPDYSWTWEQFLNIAEQLRTYGYQTAIYPMFNTLEPFIMGMGGRFSSPDRKQATGYLDSKDTVTAFQRLKEASIVSFDCNIEANCAIAIQSYASWLTYRDHLMVKVAPLPSIGGQRFNTAAISGLSMTSASQNKQLSWKLLEYLAQGQPMPMLINHSLRNQTGNSTSEWVADEALYNVWSEALRYAEPASFVYYDGYNNQRNVAGIMDTNAIFNPESEIQAILKQYANEIDTKLPHVYPEIVP